MADCNKTALVKLALNGKNQELPHLGWRLLVSSRDNVTDKDNCSIWTKDTSLQFHEKVKATIALRHHIRLNLKMEYLEVKL